METTKPSEYYFTPIQYAPSRRDYFAACALQGLLASGKFTRPSEGEEWTTLSKKDVYDEDGNETGRKKYNALAPELAWAMADWMIEQEPKQ